MNEDLRNNIKNISILYVEDDSEIADHLVNILKKFTNTVYLARNGQEGLESYKKYKPDIIISDLNMPVMTGLDMIQLIHEINPAVPVIVTTAHNEVTYLMDAIELGLDHYLLKPIDVHFLLECIKKQTLILKDKVERLQKERELRFVLDLNPNFILIATKQHIEYINLTFLSFLGHEAFETFYTGTFDLTDFFEDTGHPEAIKKNNNWFSTIIQNPHKKNIICLIKKMPDCKKEVFTFFVYSNKIPNQEKYVLSFNDITDIEEEKMEFEMKSNLDSLTGIFNRRYYEQEIKKGVENAFRYTTDLSQIFLDIDFFKQINDTYGHDAGDHVIKQIAELVQKNIRKEDTFCRTGGEEFAIIIPERKPEHAKIIAEKLRVLIEQTSFEQVNHVTCSFGVTGLVINDSPKSFYIRSDEALYKAKKNGRNRVEIL